MGGSASALELDNSWPGRKNGFQRRRALLAFLDRLVRPAGQPLLSSRRAEGPTVAWRITASLADKRERAPHLRGLLSNQQISVGAGYQGQPPSWTARRATPAPWATARRRQHHAGGDARRRAQLIVEDYPIPGRRHRRAGIDAHPDRRKTVLAGYTSAVENVAASRAGEIGARSALGSSRAGAMWRGRWPARASTPLPASARAR
jgi:hypothetical protein